MNAVIMAAELLHTSSPATGKAGMARLLGISRGQSGHAPQLWRAVWWRSGRLFELPRTDMPERIGSDRKGMMAVGGALEPPLLARLGHFRPSAGLGRQACGMEILLDHRSALHFLKAGPHHGCINAASLRAAALTATMAVAVSRSSMATTPMHASKAARSWPGA